MENRLMHRIVLLVCFCFSPLAAAQEKEIKFPVETEDFVVTVTDGEKPIEGVELTLYACRCTEDPGSHFGWPSYNTDVPTVYTSDKDGKVKLKYPVKFGAPPNWKTISEISMRFSHSDFVSDQLHVNPNESEAEKELKSGCQLTFSAVDINREPVDIAVMMAGPGRMASWNRDDKVVSSRAIPDGSWQTILVSPRDDGRHLFSGVLRVRLADNQDVNIRNLRIKPGLQINGKLSENVTRPVKNGRVMAYCIPKPAGNSWGKEDPSLTWTSTVDINEDGSFEFPSLPTTGQIQFFAVSDGWVVVDNGPEKRGSFKQGKLVEIDDLDVEDDLCDDFTLEMEETGTLVVTVTKPDGTPLQGAKVSTNPNQFMLLGGSTILGSFRDSILTARQQIETKSQPKFPRRTPLQNFSVETDEKGVATLTGIPLNRNYEVSAYHDDYALPLGERGRGKRTPYICESTDPTIAKIEMIERKSDDQ